MPKYMALLLTAALSLTLPAFAFAQTETATAEPAADVSADTVVATVNGAEITIGNLIAAYEGLKNDQKQMGDDVLFEGLTERLIQQAAISASQTELTKAMQLRLDNERRALIASDVVNGLASKIEVNAADIKAAYDLRFADFKPTTEYNASHILVPTEDEAKALIGELEGGADFAELAKEKSTGPSGPNGGSLGWFARGRMVEPFQDAVEKLDVGGISAPVQTQFGWHVIKLNQTRLPEVPTVEQMTGELQQEVFRKTLIEQIDALVGKAEIVRADLSAIDPAVLRDISQINQ